MTRVFSATLLPIAVVAALAGSPSAQSASGQGPRPFPGSPAPPAATSSQAPPAPLDTTLGVSLYPAAQLLDTYDAGSGQKYYIFGVDAPYTDVVQYYRAALKSGGRELYRAPAPLMQQFDLGRFQEDTMAFPPSVVVKDYGGGNPAGYLYVQGTIEKRFKTIVQIVPAPPASAR